MDEVYGNLRELFDAPNLSNRQKCHSFAQLLATSLGETERTDEDYMILGYYVMLSLVADQFFGAGRIAFLKNGILAGRTMFVVESPRVN